MTPLTQEWVDKAEGDYNTALRERRARKRPNYDSACFHAQQCAEKYLKARLQEAAIAIPFTHNLNALLLHVLPVEPTWTLMQPSLQTLTAYAVGFRYPGNNATLIQARDALKMCGEVRAIVRLSLGLA